MTKDEFFSTVIPALMTFMGVAIPALLAWLTAIVRCWMKKQNEARDREALHSALETGVLAGELKYGANGSRGDVVAYAVDYAQKSVPDAMKALNPPADVLAKIAMSKQTNTEKFNA